MENKARNEAEISKADGKEIASTGNTGMVNTKSISLILLLALLIALPFVLDQPFTLHLIILMFVYLALAHSWNLLAGYAGQVNLGQYIFFGLGAYTSTLLWTRAAVSPWLGMLAAILIALVFSILIGYPTFKLKTVYFSIATLLVGQVFLLIMRNWQWAGGASGLFIQFTESSFINLQFQSKIPYYYIALAIACLSTLVIYWIENSRLGFYFRAIKDEPDATQMIGIDILKFKLIAMIIHGSITAVTGAFYAQYVLFIDPDSVFSYVMTVLTMLAVMIGGLGTLVGPIIGVIVMVPLSELTRVYLGGSGRALDLVIYGLAAILLGVFRPRGLLGLVQEIREKIQQQRPASDYSKSKRVG